MYKKYIEHAPQTVSRFGAKSSRTGRALLDLSWSGARFWKRKGLWFYITKDLVVLKNKLICFIASVAFLSFLWPLRSSVMFSVIICNETLIVNEFKRLLA